MESERTNPGLESIKPSFPDSLFVPGKILYFFWGLLLLGFLIFPFLTHAGDTGLLQCRFHELTGLSCPTCGMSRSLYEWVHFHMAASFRMHLFGPVIYILALILFIEVIIKLITDKSLINRLLKKNKNRTIKSIFMTLGTLWIVYWLVRMGVELYLL